MPEAALRQTGAEDGLAPVACVDARLLMLGSFPGRASLAARQYYAHPRNQFWPILGALLSEDLSASAYAWRLATVQRSRIAIWDVYASCLRAGSLDSAIRDARRNPFEALFEQAPRIGAVAFNGATAARFAPWFGSRGLKLYRLPSTSPAHARLDFAAKLAAWRVLRDDGWIGAPGEGR